MRTLLILAGAFAVVPGADAADLTFTGYARAPDSGGLMYVETHYVWNADTPEETRVVSYRCPANDRPFARKQLAYGARRRAPAFDFEDARSGSAEGLGVAAGIRAVYSRLTAGDPQRRANLAADADLVADAGFDEFVRERWDALSRGEELSAPFLVPSLLEGVPFRVRKRRDVTMSGEPAAEIRLSMAGPLGWFLPDIEVTYRLRDRRLLAYRGLTNIRDARGKLLAARIDFPDAARRAGAPPREQLLAEPLVTRCD